MAAFKPRVSQPDKETRTKIAAYERRLDKAFKTIEKCVAVCTKKVADCTKNVEVCTRELQMIKSCMKAPTSGLRRELYRDKIFGLLTHDSAPIDL